MHFGLFYPSVSSKSIHLVVPFVFQAASYTLACYFGPMTELLRTTIRWIFDFINNNQFQSENLSFGVFEKNRIKEPLVPVILKTSKNCLFSLKNWQRACGYLILIFFLRTVVMYQNQFFEFLTSTITNFQNSLDI